MQFAGLRQGSKDHGQRDSGHITCFRGLVKADVPNMELLIKLTLIQTVTRRGGFSLLSPFSVTKITSYIQPQSFSGASNVWSQWITQRILSCSPDPIDFSCLGLIQIPFANAKTFLFSFLVTGVKLYTLNWLESILHHTSTFPKLDGLNICTN